MRYKGFRRALLSTLRNYIVRDSSGDYTRLGRLRIPVLLTLLSETPLQLWFAKIVMICCDFNSFHKSGVQRRRVVRQNSYL